MGPPPPISMTSCLLTGANRAPFEALPQKPHPLERRVKNTELAITSPQATCRSEASWAVTPPAPPTAGATGRPLHTHLQQQTVRHCTPVAEKPPPTHPTTISAPTSEQALRSNLAVPVKTFAKYRASHEGFCPANPPHRDHISPHTHSRGWFS